MDASKMVFDSRDHAFMAQALRLAERGAYTTRPNPMVGCVLTQGEHVVGEGWHKRAGGPHAEILALGQAQERARGGTAYVSLEPCSHHGRTPPCVDALIEAGIARVVVASSDPNPKVAGSGLDRLRTAGIKVTSGLMQAQARELNRGFFSRIERGRPWLRVKLAMSLDARTALANGESKWITGAPARDDVQRWRARAGAILTGSGTVLADNPRLTARVPDVDIAPVLRVLLDRQMRTPTDFYMLDGSAPTLLFHAPELIPEPRFDRIECEPLAANVPDVALSHVLANLAARGINEVQVEAGPTLCGALFAHGLVDELLLYVAPVFLGSSARPLMDLPSLTDMTARWHLKLLDERHIGDDWRLLFRPKLGVN